VIAVKNLCQSRRRGFSCLRATPFYDNSSTGAITKHWLAARTVDLDTQKMSRRSIL
jgi:hypothetical protein